MDHGIEQRLAITPETAGNVYSGGGISVPPTLADAPATFRSSVLAQEAFGAEVVQHYAHLAQREVGHARRQVTGAERQRWFSRA
ncbi:hypothetical protein K1J60_32040 [Streptomyces akebiae]|uniref:GS catalytic domain-containing protein n=2 Tax=Streptomyces akebiae TaxID=2865673 RepID=A0ABX8XXZ9_9ACTN|nr:hypothetical protein K1J60_32040 [Streptomyces akebiae]